MKRSLSLTALQDVPMVHAGDNLADIITNGLAASDLDLENGDVLVLAQKIVSKSEGRIVNLDDVVPSARAIELGAQAHKDPRLVELILSESTEVMRIRPGVIIVEHRSGLILANAGIDQSNVGCGEDVVLLLPKDADATASALRAELQQRTGLNLAVLIIDSIGRAWRTGTVGTAIGISGMPGLVDLRSRPDLTGRQLETSELGVADEAAAAASLLMGQANEGTPIVLLRGLPYERRDGRLGELIRPKTLDLFR